MEDTPKISNNEDNEKPVEIKQPSLLVQHFQGLAVCSPFGVTGFLKPFTITGFFCTIGKDSFSVESGKKMSNTEANAVVGQRLKNIRKALRLKQKEMAKTLGIAASSFSEIETGITGINTDLYQTLSDRFNVNIEYLVNGRGEMFYNSGKVQTTLEKDETEYPFDSDIDSIEKLVFMMRKSTYFRLSILQYASEFFMSKEDLIRKNLENPLLKNS